MSTETSLSERVNAAESGPDDASERFVPVPAPLLHLAATTPLALSAWSHIYDLWFTAKGKGPIAISQNSLSKAIGCGKNQLGEAIRVLVESGYLARYRMKTGGKYKYVPLRRRTVLPEGTLPDHPNRYRPRRGDGTVPSEGTVNGKPSPQEGYVKRDKNQKNVSAADAAGQPTAGAGNAPPENIDEKPAAPKPAKYPRQCPKHQDAVNNDKCGGCKTARETAEAEEAAEAQEKSLQGAAADKARGAKLLQDIADCGMCGIDGYLNGVVCHHVPDQEETNTRGAAAVRAAIRETARTEGVESLTKLIDSTPSRKGTP